MRNCFWHSIYGIEQKEKNFPNVDVMRNLFRVIFKKKLIFLKKLLIVSNLIIF